MYLLFRIHALYKTISAFLLQASVLQDVRFPCVLSQQIICACLCHCINVVHYNHMPRVVCLNSLRVYLCSWILKTYCSAQLTQEKQKGSINYDTYCWEPVKKKNKTKQTDPSELKKRHRGDGSVVKSCYHTCSNTWVLIPRTHVKYGCLGRACVILATLWGEWLTAETGGSWKTHWSPSLGYAVENNKETLKKGGH